MRPKQAEADYDEAKGDETELGDELTLEQQAIFDVAVAALQGIIANPIVPGGSESMARRAVDHAEALVAELKKRGHLP